MYQQADDSQTTFYPNAIPANIPCVLLVEPKTDNEEKIKVTATGTGTITVVRGYGGSVAKEHSIGAALVDYNSPEYVDEIADVIEVEHESDGGHKLTDPKISGAIKDANDNELVKFTATASAVNEVSVKNTATGNGPEIEATGGDTNIDLHLKSKGTGQVKVNGAAISAFAGEGPQGFLINGKIVTSVASNNLTIAIKNLAGNDPSAGDPVKVRIGTTVRTISAALSVTLNAATNWFNAGSSELATKEIDYFVYLVWKAADSTMQLAAARRPDGRVVSDFSSTSTDWTYLARSAALAGTDEVENIGRCNATLSAGAGYTWTIPATSIIVNQPIFETRYLSWTPTYTPSGSMTYGTVTTNTAIYQIRRNRVYINHESSGTTGGSASTSIKFTLPVTLNLNGATNNPILPATLGTGQSLGGYAQAVSTTEIRVLKYDTSNWALASGLGPETAGELPI